MPAHDVLHGGREVKKLGVLRLEAWVVTHVLVVVSTIPTKVDYDFFGHSLITCSWMSIASLTSEGYRPRTLLSSITTHCLSGSLTSVDGSFVSPLTGSISIRIEVIIT